MNGVRLPGGSLSCFYHLLGEGHKKIKGRCITRRPIYLS
jgi:hypothetical protein